MFMLFRLISSDTKKTESTSVKNYGVNSISFYVQLKRKEKKY